MMQEKAVLTKEEIQTVLFKMGMPANLKGFGYITDSILLLDQEKDIKVTYLYLKVAQLNDTTPQRVERAIRHALEIVRSCKGDYEVVDHYVGFINCANAASLLMLLTKIREDLKEEKRKSSQVVISGITEKRFMELMKQVYKEFLMDTVTKLTNYKGHKNMRNEENAKND